MTVIDIRDVARLDNERVRLETAAEILEGIQEGMGIHSPESAAFAFTIGYLKGRIADICRELEGAGVEI